MEKLLSIAKEVSIALIQREETVSVIESSSGGLISSSLLAQPGASAYYIGGQVVYTAKSIRGVTGLRLRDLKEKNIRSSSEPFALLLGGRDINLAIGPLFDDVTVNVLYNVVNTIVQQSITTVEMWVAYGGSTETEVIDIVENIFEHNDIIEAPDGDMY